MSRSTLLVPPLPTKPIKLSTDRLILEKDVEEDNRKYAKSLGVMFEKFTSPARRSVPDRMLTFTYGLIVFIEYKAPGKKATPKQWQDHCERRGHEVLVYVVDNADVGRALIERLVELDGCSDDPGRRGHWVNEEVIVNGQYYTNDKGVEK